MICWNLPISAKPMWKSLRENMKGFCPWQNIKLSTKESRGYSFVKLQLRSTLGVTKHATCWIKPKVWAADLWSCPLHFTSWSSIHELPITPWLMILVIFMDHYSKIFNALQNIKLEELRWPSLPACAVKAKCWLTTLKLFLGGFA